MINILILGGGVSTINQDSQDYYPVYLTEVQGASLIERIVESTNPLTDSSVTFAFQSNEIEKFHLDNIIKVLNPKANLIKLPNSTQGSACTTLYGVCQLPAESEVLIISANEFVDVNYELAINEFRRKDCNAGVFVFESIHPRYSYVRLGEVGQVSEVTQHNPITHNATTGLFWFKNSSELVESIKNMIRKDANIRDKFYIAPALNELILEQKNVGVYNITSEHYYPLKDADQIYQYKMSSK